MVGSRPGCPSSCCSPGRPLRRRHEALRNAAVAVGVTLVAAGGALLGLRCALGTFAPDPPPILGRPIAPAEAPSLSHLVEGLAGRIGALKPEAVVVGLTDGFFVTAGPAVLEPGGARLLGRILYLPHVARMRGDEIAAIIAQELTHYAGGDTAYSPRFLPLNAGHARSTTRRFTWRPSRPTHPPTRERVLALGQVLGPDLLGAAIVRRRPKRTPCSRRSVPHAGR